MNKWKNKKTNDELNEFLDALRQKLDVNEATAIYNVLKENKFNSRMQIKLITQRELDVMFKGETALSLGALALLWYQINFLNDQSPLPKRLQNKIKEENNLQMCTTTNATECLSDNKVRCKYILLSTVIFKLCYPCTQPCRIKNVLKCILQLYFFVFYSLFYLLLQSK